MMSGELAQLYWLRSIISTLTEEQQAEVERCADAAGINLTFLQDKVRAKLRGEGRSGKRKTKKE